MDWTYILGYLLGFADIQEYGSIFLGGVCRICFGTNRTDDICGIHRYRKEYGEPFETDAEVMLTTIEEMILQIPIMAARIVGMITFH